MSTGGEIDGRTEGRFTSERESTVLENLKQLGGEAYYTQIYDLMLKLPNEKRMSKDLLSKTLNGLVESGFIKRNPPLKNWRRGQKATYTLTSLEQEMISSYSKILKYYFASRMKILELWKAIEENKDLQELDILYDDSMGYRDYFDSKAFSIIAKFSGKPKEIMSHICESLSDVIQRWFKLTFKRYPHLPEEVNTFEEESFTIDENLIKWAKEKRLLDNLEIDRMRSIA